MHSPSMCPYQESAVERSCPRSLQMPSTNLLRMRPACRSGRTSSKCDARSPEVPMARLVVLYKTPKDAGAFDAYYFNTHVPIAKRIPGLRKYEVSRGPVATPMGASGLHLVATLHFDDVAAIQEAFASPQGQAAAADVQKFASGGVDMFIFDNIEV